MITFTNSQSRLFVGAGMIIAAGVAVVFLGSAVSFESRNSRDSHGDSHRIRVGSAELFVQYAATEATRERGLSGREPLGAREGLLFFFPVPAVYGFWMKDMRFDIDIIWIKDSRIIGVSERVPAPRTPNVPLPTYYPPSTVDMVLEVGAGVAGELGIHEGDALSILE